MNTTIQLLKQTTSRPLRASAFRRLNKKPKWRIKPLLDKTTREELGEFYRVLRASENSTTLIKGFVPDVD